MYMKMEGIPEVLKLLRALPRLAEEPFVETAVEILELGIDTMRKHVDDTIWESESLGDKTTGDLFRSIDGNLELILGSERSSAIIEVGSRLPHAKYASSEIAETTMNKVVFMVMPFGEVTGNRGDIGNYRFIGTRPRIPSHPFLERTRDDLLEKLPRLYKDKFEHLSIEIQREGTT